MFFLPGSRMLFFSATEKGWFSRKTSMFVRRRLNHQRDFAYVSHVCREGFVGAFPVVRREHFGARAIGIPYLLHSIPYEQY